MADFDRTLPAALAEANALDYDYNDGKGVDFEPYSEFQSADDNASWIRAWTGNSELDGADLRVFGQDGQIIKGLYAAGEAAGFGGGGVHGYRSLEGTFLGGCLFSGRNAGRAAAKAVS